MSVTGQDIDGHGFGHRDNPADSRDYRYIKIAEPVVGALPDVIDLRGDPAMFSVHDQGRIGSCVAVSGNLMAQFVLAVEGAATFEPSFLFSYYDARSVEGHPHEDTGLAPRDLYKSLQKRGVPPADLWPYDIGKFATRPPKTAYTEAKRHQTLTYWAVDLDPGLMRLCLAAGYPFTMAYDVYTSFRQVGKDGVMPVPKQGEHRLGGHQICVVGFDQPRGLVICRNQWGANWGDGGDFYMPVAALSHCRDATTIRTVEHGDELTPKRVASGV